MNSNRKKRVRRVLVTILILAVVVAVVGIILVRQCLSFDENGAHVIDRYGVLEAEQNDSPSQAETEPEEPEQSAETQGSTDEAEPEQHTRAVVLSADTLTDTDSRAQLSALAQNGMIDTVIVDIKDPNGYLNLYVNDDYPVQGDIDAFAYAISELRSAGIHVTGRMYCLHDELAAEQNDSLAMQYERGGMWTDYDRTHWLDPTNNGTVQYLSAIAQAAVQAGCDEIVLADFTFPPRGHLDRIAFDSYPESQAGVLTSALQKIQVACQGVPVSLTADSLASLTELSANGVEDGVPLGDIAALLGTADRLLIPVNDESEAVSVIGAIQQINAEAMTILLFSDVRTWLAYDGDAAIYADGDTIAAITSME